MKIHGLAQYEASLALSKAMSCCGTHAKSYGTLLFVSQWFGMGFGVSIPHHTRLPIGECE